MISIVFERELVNTSNRTYADTLVLYQDNWDDYFYRTSYNVFYYDENRTEHCIGDIKIYDARLDQNVRNIYDIREFITNGILDGSLSAECCSLGQNLEYYKNLKKYLPNRYREVLSRLKDMATNKSILDRFRDFTGVTTSLFREVSAVKALNEAHELLGGIDRNHDMSFSFSYKPPYTELVTKIAINYTKKNKVFPFRINAVVGKNGAGKTSMLSCLANAISGTKDEDVNAWVNFQERPSFYKVLTCSFSAFDTFKRAEKDKAKSYIYCGIQVLDDSENADSSEYRTMTKAQIAELFKISYERISKGGRYSEWKSIILELIGAKEFQNLCEQIKTENYNLKLSSGQYMLVLSMTLVIANIEKESILLIDEPELHLHPNAIASLMRMFNNLLETYNSYALIATHSPLVLQEIPSSNITVLERKAEGILTAREPRIECFGASISDIIDDTFDVRSNESSFKTILRNAINNMSEEEIIDYFKNGLSLNAKIYLKTIIEGVK